MKDLTIKERILYYIDYQRLNKQDFFKKIDVTSASFRGKGLKSHISSKYIISIIENYDINPIWLLTGDGEILNSEKVLKMNDGYKEKYYQCLEQQNELLRENAELKNIQSADTVFTKRKLKE